MDTDKEVNKQMNERVEKKLQRIVNVAKNIKGMCECIICDADEVTESDDLFIIEQQFERITRAANDGYDLTRNTYDDFDEEDEE